MIVFPQGEIAEKYELLRKLAEGGMGAVYLVRHRLLGELRVVKTIRPQLADNEGLRIRFRREAEASIRLRHPNIAQIYDFVIDDHDMGYSVMELVDGLTLKQILRAGPPPQAFTLEVACQSLEALGYLHDLGYLHRDVSPDNIMVTGDHRGAPRVKVIDLGLAKRFSGELDLTATGMFIGKVRYASPEQFARPQAALGPASDLYSFAVVLHTLLTGVSPIRGNSFEEIVAAHVLGGAPDFKVGDPEGRLNAGLRDLLTELLAKDPQERPASAQEVIQRLQPFREPRSVPGFRDIERRVDATLKPGELQRFAQLAKELPAPVAPPRPPASGDSEMEPTRRLDRRASPPAVGSARFAGFRPSRKSLALGLGAALVSVIFALNLGGYFDRWSDTLGLWFEAAGQSQAPLPSAASSGRLVVEATPWGRVTTVETAEGRTVALDPEGVFTPAVLWLPAGGYRVTLSHPSGGSTTVAARVSPSTSARIDVALLPVTAAGYLSEQGLLPLEESAGAGR